MGLRIAWQNATDNWARALVAMGSVCFAVLLLYMELGFYATAARSSTLIYDQLEFDLLLTSPQYVHLRVASQFPRRRLVQATQTPGVARALPVHVGSVDYRNQQDGSLHEAVVLGVEPTLPAFREPEAAARLVQLTRLDAAIMDAVTTTPDFGTFAGGDLIELQGRRLDLVDTYRHGTGFIADGAVVTSVGTMSRLLPGFTPASVSLGLVQLAPGADRAAIARALAVSLPEDVRVWTRGAINDNEERFFLDVKPSGILFGAGVVLGFCVGGVVLYQILASEVIRQLREYATLKAMGFSDGFLDRVVLMQACIYAILGFAPGTLLAWLLYRVTAANINLPLYMTWQRFSLALGLSLVMCTGSAYFASHKVHRTDPADLF